MGEERQGGKVGQGKIMLRISLWKHRERPIYQKGRNFGLEEMLTCFIILRENAIENSMQIKKKKSLI